MTATTQASTSLWQHCHDVARLQGLAPALTALREALPEGTAMLGGDGAAVLPEGDVPSDATVIREAELPGGSVVVALAGPAPAEADPVLVTGAVWVRLGLSAALLDACVAYLGERRSGDTTLLRQQMVQGDIADAVIGQLEVRAELAAADEVPDPVLSYLHTKLIEVDRGLLRLLGASGYLAGGLGEVADFSELLAGAYAPAEVAR